MANATSNRTALRLIKEVVLGTTPATPAFQTLRYTGESLNYTVKTEQSKEIRDDRNTADVVRVSSDASGDIQFELSGQSFDALIEAAMGNSFSTPTAGLSTVKNGVTPMSFTIQKAFQDATSTVYHTFRGARVGGMSLDFKTGSILTGSFNVMAISADMSTAQIAGATILAAKTTPVMNSVTDIIEIKENGVASTAVIRSMSLNLNNNLRAQDAIGSLNHVGIALGKMEITGSLEIYFSDIASYTKFVNGTAFSLSFKTQDSSGDYYRFTIPAAKYESGQVVSGGLDQDVVLQASWRAIYDTTAACMIQIDRYDA